MPELPEVETIKRDLQKIAPGRSIKSIKLKDKSVARAWPKNYHSFFKGLKINSVDRRAKLILLKLSNGSAWAIHLKMTGQIVVKVKAGLLSGGHPIDNVRGVPNKFTRLTISLSGGLDIYFNDVRKFGYWQFVPAGALSNLLSRYGPEPLSKNLTIQKLSDNLNRRSRTTIKAALLDQTVVAGLGNIYVDESLFLAGLKPDRRVNSLTIFNINKLFKSIRLILKKATRARGTSFSSYLDAVGRPGSYWDKRLVYGRAGLACRRCRSVIIKNRTAGRGTHFCPVCQK
ncbi:MAG: bifunctional DNA-formamidopyrimidine glycosylase/DNA-(apurinic or apyrimidinic site) lyase [Patescibacteria group bacterium]